MQSLTKSVIVFLIIRVSKASKDPRFDSANKLTSHL